MPNSSARVQMSLMLMASKQASTRRRQIAEHELGDALGVARRLGAAALRLAITELNRTFERAHHVTQANVGALCA